MLRAILTTTCLLAGSGAVGAPPRTPDAGEFIYRSVLDGLRADGVPPALAAALAKVDEDFVNKCKICALTRKALETHGGLREVPAVKADDGLPEALVTRLKSVKIEIRQGALRELIQRYIDRGHAKLDATPEQRASLQRDLEDMRKAALPALAPGQKFCPSCDGACRLTPKL